MFIIGIFPNTQEVIVYFGQYIKFEAVLQLFY